MPSPTPKQLEAYGKLKDSQIKTLVYGGAAGGGKSWLGCEWLLQCCHYIPGSRWFIGREELKRIRQSTVITFYKVAKSHGFTDFFLNGQDNFIGFGNGSRIDLLDLRYMPSDPLYERFGSLEYTGGWIEEGGEVDFGAYDTLKTRIGRHLNAELNLKPILLVTCNPKKNWLYTEIYRPFKEGKLPEQVAFIQAYVQDNPYITRDYIEQLENTKDKAKKERLLFGNWEYDDDPAALCEYDKITDLFSNDFDTLKGQKYITADVARLGSDKICIGLWDGWRVKVKTFEKLRITESYEYIKRLQQENQVPLSHVICDEDGVGGGLVDMLGCKGFINNSRALPNPNAAGNEPENYENLQAQCAFRLAERINSNGLFIENASPKEQEEITEELEVLKQKHVDRDGKKGIVGKEDVKKLIGRSPDYRDMLLMREWFALQKERAMDFGW
ncbi:hypothetical protein C8N40_111102 [Pontibacter mucosus]|uniref:Phage terminase large subunit N-terminal domain-containing protein n=1 Tax=Pontibacter mucosus TaxID=1649266 RepID=A0A2T5YD11_9BACT|nr:phage terminase large subunit [Pontibacter mucosus]PTX14437.1 hypothetical protein C8N40_111102 [Pontibacter mucosus]